MTRQGFLTAGIAALGLASLRGGSTELLPPAARDAFRQGAGVYRRKLGEAEIIVLSDGAIRLPAWPSFGGPSVTQSEVEAAFRFWNEELPAPILHINMVLIRIGGRSILVDTGYGPGQTFRPGAGLLQDNLAANGIKAEEIDTVLITHAHPDHLWGVFKNGTRLFPSATLLINKEEPGPWLLSDEQIRARPEKLRPMLTENRKRLEEFLPSATLIEAGTEIAPGLRTLSLPGHTPGHLGLELQSQGSRFIHAVDTIPHARVQFDHPDWTYALDSDPSLAGQTRLGLLNQVADTDTLLMGSHFPFPALGFVRRASSRFLFQPEPWHWA